MRWIVIADLTEKPPEISIREIEEEIRDNREAFIDSVRRQHEDWLCGVSCDWRLMGIFPTLQKARQCQSELRDSINKIITGGNAGQTSQ